MNGKTGTILLPVFAMAVLSLAAGALAQPPTVTRAIAAERQRAASEFRTRDRIAGAPAMALQVDMETEGGRVLTTGTLRRLCEDRGLASLPGPDFGRGIFDDAHADGSRFAGPDDDGGFLRDDVRGSVPGEVGSAG